MAVKIPNLHKDLKDAQIHPPKGFQGALSDTHIEKTPVPGEDPTDVRWYRNFWQRPIINLVDGALVPPTVIDEDRYILVELTATTAHEDWDGATFNDIVQMDGTITGGAGLWYKATPEDGFSIFNLAEGGDYFFNSATWAAPTSTAVLQSLASAPATPFDGQIYYNTTDNVPYFYDGSAWVDMSGDIRSISSTDPHVTVINGTGADVTITLDATSDNTVDTIVSRDSSGDFSANEITVSEICGLIAPSADDKAANKAYVDSTVIASRIWKELVLSGNQLAPTGIQHAQLFIMTAVAVIGDTFSLSTGAGAVETWTAVASGAGSQEFNVGATADDQMDNLRISIATDSTRWGAKIVDSLDEINSRVILIHEIGINGEPDEMYGVFETAASVWVVDYGGEADYTKSTVIGLPSASTGTTSFGFSRAIASVIANETHTDRANDQINTWDADSTSWVLISGGGVTASNGVVKVGNDIQGVNANTTSKGVAELATQGETEAKTDATRTVTPQSLLNFPIKKVFTLEGDDAVTEFTANHNLGTTWVLVQVKSRTTPYPLVEVEIEIDDSNNVGINFTVAPATGANYDVIIIG